MVGSGCQVQPRALPAAAMVRLQGPVLDGAGRTDGAGVKDRRGGWRLLLSGEACNLEELLEISYLTNQPLNGPCSG